ncbi:hypothetical protein NDU88_006034 [Pleurodeles waltl]|uniref:Myb/SANT-like DNA-binding domain-containing protein n=1 Tax=Pleurodeles waltl TaxID=8319 RepID=A0AAV7VKV4_PLEWA|nr:hypothetical protein NDU88_006034 [Pleurodeles waltl]
MSRNRSAGMTCNSGSILPESRVECVEQRQNLQQTQHFVQRRAKMDPRCLHRPQEDDNRPGTSQEDPHKTQDREKKKRNCHFSAEEQEILVKETTEHQHQLFVTSKFPISRREAIWQQIVDTINSVAKVQRTVIECKKCWHDCKRRTKEKMARNRKAALQTGGGCPAPQEALDHMEEMVAAVIPEEIVTGIQGQDSADYQETTHMQGKSHGELKCTNVNCQWWGIPTTQCMADLAAYLRDLAAILKNQQILLAAVLPIRPPQVAATGMSDSTSTHTEVCVAPLQPPPPRAEEATHTSEDEDQEQITFTRKSTR